MAKITTKIMTATQYSTFINQHTTKTKCRPDQDHVFCLGHSPKTDFGQCNTAVYILNRYILPKHILKFCAQIKIWPSKVGSKFQALFVRRKIPGNRKTNPKQAIHGNSISLQNNARLLMNLIECVFRVFDMRWININFIDYLTTNIGQHDAHARSNCGNAEHKSTRPVNLQTNPFSTSRNGVTR